MSSTIDPQPEPPTNDELVAYLDGELAPEECRRVEDRLAADDDYRQQLRELDQAWEALNVLPQHRGRRLRADDDRARDGRSGGRSSRNTRPSRRRRNPAYTRWWVAAAVAAVVIGFVATRALWPSQQQRPCDRPAADSASRRTRRPISAASSLSGLSNKIPLQDFVPDEDEIERRPLTLKRRMRSRLNCGAEWLKTLTSDERADLAAQARTFKISNGGVPKRSSGCETRAGD